jgi:hypothetical protein
MTRSWKRVLALALALGGLIGCKKDKPPEETPSEVRASAKPATPQPVEGEHVDEGPDPAIPAKLDASKLEAFIKYQKTMLAVHAELVKDFKEVGARVDAGQAESMLGVLSVGHDAVKRLEKRAEAEEKARKASGLTSNEISRFEELVGEVITQRSIMKNFNYDQQLTQMEKMLSSVPAEQRAETSQALEAIKKQRDNLTHLTEARERFGSTDVDLMLSKEKELTENWEKLIAVWGGTAPGKAAREKE